jgi:ABC-2 type transport system ATP-binding protein
LKRDLRWAKEGGSGKRMSELIAIDRLTKWFGHIHAVEDVSFTVLRGEVLGFLGPNGAGKSTTMKMLAGFLYPTSGTATLCGFDVLEQPIEAKRRMGYLPEGAPAYPDMTPAGFLGFIAGIRGFAGAEKDKRIALAVERANLKGVMHQPIETLSKGYKRRVGLAQALLHDPPVLIMDEPTDGLDPNQKHEVRTLIQEMAPDKAIIISTHLLEEVEAVCSRAIIIAHGRIVADGTPASLAALDPWHNAVSLTLAGAAAPDKIAQMHAKLAQIQGVLMVEDVEADGHRWLIARIVTGANALADIGAQARDGRWPVTEIRLEHGRLDKVFRDITTGAPERPAAAA